MTWYVNDLSLCAQYSQTATFLDDLKKLMSIRSKVPLLDKKLFCSRTLYTRPVTATLNFREAVKLLPSQNVHLVLAWLTKNGPFWEDSREFCEEDYFEHCGQDVTNSGLGEAARRLLVGLQASSFSFSRGGFDYSAIDILHGLPEDLLDTVPVPNLWDMNSLHQCALVVTPSPENWPQMLEQAQHRFDKLLFSQKSIDRLRKEPFSQYVVERVFVLLDVLQRFMDYLCEDGSYSDENHELIAKHFVGEKAWFTDESVSNKRDFREDLSFPDTEHDGQKVFCPWHGKIKTPQYRIHFEWPVEARPKLRIFYIGPKITKG
jgi:hypothetical protein